MQNNGGNVLWSHSPGACQCEDGRSLPMVKGLNKERTVNELGIMTDDLAERCSKKCRLSKHCTAQNILQ